MQIWNGKTKAKKSPKNRIWEGLGLHLGGVWHGLGRLLGALGRLWGASGVSLWRSWRALGCILALMDTSGLDLGSPGPRFWRLPNLIFGRFSVLSLLFCLADALIAAGNPTWHLLWLFVPPCSAAVRAQHMECFKKRGTQKHRIFPQLFDNCMHVCYLRNLENINFT